MKILFIYTFMKHLKTYEGLFDFFKRKKQDKPASYDYIIDCLYDIIDERRIKSSLEYPNEDFGIHIEPKKLFAKGPNPKYSTIKIAGLTFRSNKDKLIFVMKYSIGGELDKIISDEEVNTILQEVKSHLKGSGCEMSFYIGFGYSEGRTSKEYSDFMTMIRNECDTKPKELRERKVTVVIKSEMGFEDSHNQELLFRL